MNRLGLIAGTRNHRDLVGLVSDQKCHNPTESREGPTSSVFSGGSALWANMKSGNWTIVPPSFASVTQCPQSLAYGRPIWPSDRRADLASEFWILALRDPNRGVSGARARGRGAGSRPNISRARCLQALTAVRGLIYR